MTPPRADTVAADGRASTGRGESTERERSVMIGMVTGGVQLPVSLVAALLGNSIVLVADLLRATAELLTIVLSWFALRAVRRASRDRFNYGLGKVESAASVVVGGALLVSFTVVLGAALARLVAPAPIGDAMLGLVAALVGTAGSIWLWRRNYAIACRAASPVMDAQWRLYRSKTVTNGTVALSVGVALAFKDHAWAAYADPLGSLVIAGYLLYSAWAVASSSMHDLLDRALEESRQLLILRVLARHFEAYDDVGEIRSRRSGGRIYVEIVLGFDPERSLGDVQGVVDRMRADLEAILPDSTVVIVPTATRRA
jgi:cation diffusion facilitator family transporter